MKNLFNVLSKKADYLTALALGNGSIQVFRHLSEGFGYAAGQALLYGGAAALTTLGLYCVVNRLFGPTP